MSIKINLQGERTAIKNNKRGTKIRNKSYMVTYNGRYARVLGLLVFQTNGNDYGW